MSALRTLPAAAVLALMVLVWSAPAASANVLAPEDATELAQLLADATEEQGVCYSWAVQVDDENGVESSMQEGSSFGPDTSPENEPGGSECDAEVALSFLITYTSEYSESEDYAVILVESPGDVITDADIESLGYDTGDLLGDDDDKAVFNMVAGLPLLAADKGLADPIPYEPPTAEERQQAAKDQPTNSPASDWWRMYWWLPVFGIPALLVLFGYLWARRYTTSDSVAHPMFAKDPTRQGRP